MPIIVIPFAVFFFCCAAQFYFLRRVRQALIQRHPQVWLELSGKAWFVDNAVYRFIRRRQDKGLNDPDLTAKTKQAAILYYVAIITWVIYAIGLATGIGLRPL